MATSTKVKFKLETLREKAIESLDLRIAQAELEVASFEDDEALEARIAEWRARQEARISELFSKLGEGALDNYALAKWTVEDIPKVDRWERQAAERNLRELVSKKAQVLAKSQALVGDEDGNIALTKTQLSEFFGL